MKRSVVISMSAIGLISSVTSLAYSPLLAYAWSLVSGGYGIWEGVRRLPAEPAVKVGRSAATFLFGAALMTAILAVLPALASWSVELAAALAGMFVVAFGITVYGLGLSLGSDMRIAWDAILSRVRR